MEMFIPPCLGLKISYRTRKALFPQSPYDSKHKIGGTMENYVGLKKRLEIKNRIGAGNGKFIYWIYYHEKGWDFNCC